MPRRTTVALATVLGFVAAVGCESESRQADEPAEAVERQNRSPTSPPGVERNPAQPNPERPPPSP